MQKLEKIDALRSRFSLSYQEAGRLLEEYDGDVLKALDELEKLKKANRQRAEQYIEELTEEYACKY